MKKNTLCAILLCVLSSHAFAEKHGKAPVSFEDDPKWIAEHAARDRYEQAKWDAQMNVLFKHAEQVITEPVLVQAFIRDNVTEWAQDPISTDAFLQEQINGKNITEIRQYNFDGECHVAFISNGEFVVEDDTKYSVGHPSAALANMCGLPQPTRPAHTNNTRSDDYDPTVFIRHDIREGSGVNGF